MKKTLLLLTLALAVFSAKADCFFSTSEGDTIMLHPSILGNGKTFVFCATFDGRLDQWSLTFSYPNGLSAIDVKPDTTKVIPFVNQWGHDTICRPPVSILSNNTIISSVITEFGYWDPDNDGFYDTYGTVKWEAGYYYNMFTTQFSVDQSFRRGTIGITGVLSSTHDWRGGTIGNGVTFYRGIYLWVGYIRGDADGNGSITMSDVNTITAYLLDPDNHPLDEFKLEAADFNQDGYVTIDDVAAIINYLLTA